MKDEDDLVEVEIDGEKTLVPRSLAEKLDLKIVAKEEKVKKDYTLYYQTGLMLLALAVLILVWQLFSATAPAPSPPTNTTDLPGNHFSPLLASCYCILFRRLKEKDERESKYED